MVSSGPLAHTRGSGICADFLVRPKKLYETAYALACDVAAADGRITQEEARVLYMIRDRLGIGRLPAAAIERGSRARHLTL